MKPSNSELRPENSPLGSPESRAAARLLANRRKATLIPVMVIHINGVAVTDGDAEHEPKGWNIDDELSFTGMAIYSPLNAETMGNSPVCWMTRQELRILEARQREYEKRCGIDREDSRRSEKEVCDLAALDEKKPEAVSPIADAAPRYAPVEEKSDREREEAARESRVEEYGNYLARRPIARKPWYRRRLWPDGVWR